MIHAGDLTDEGSQEAIQRQLDWLGEVRRQKRFEKVLVIGGNHDAWFDDRIVAEEGARRMLFGRDSVYENNGGRFRWPRGVCYLDGTRNGYGGARQDAEGCMTIEFKEGPGRAKGRKLNVWGCGWVPRCGGPDHA